MNTPEQPQSHEPLQGPCQESSLQNSEQASTQDAPRTKSGFIALVGRPSTGKSTLINALCGHKVAITSPKPQTTRNVIRGIVNRNIGEHSCQFVLLDTPGFSNSQDLLAKKLREELHSALRRAEVILYLLDLSRPPHRTESSLAVDEDNGSEVEGEIEEENLLALLSEILEKEAKESKSPRPICLAFNKSDLIAPDETSPNAEKKKQVYKEYLDLVQQYFPELGETQCFELSAKKKTGLDELLAHLSTYLPEGPPLYEEDIYTDQEPQFRIQELIREQALSFCGKELPYALHVQVADLERRPIDGHQEQHKGQYGEQHEEQPSPLWIRAFLLVERESQKGILVGKGGARIREIRKRSTKAVRKEFACPVQLDLQVKVDYKWRRKRQGQRR